MSKALGMRKKQRKSDIISQHTGTVYSLFSDRLI